MRFNKKNPACAASLTLVLAIPAVAADGEGFLEGATVNVLNRNIYFSQDFRHGDTFNNPQTGEKKHLRAEWAHGVIANFESGFTPGMVGFGLDVRGQFGFKMDGGDGRVGNGMAGNGIIPRRGYDFDGKPKSQFGRTDVALKVRLFDDTVLRYGDVRPLTPVVNTSDIRLLPQSFRGGNVVNTSIKGLTLQAGKLESSADRTATAHGGDLGTAYGGRFKDANDFVYFGADYQANDRLLLRVHHGRLDDVWNQLFLGFDLKQPLREGLTARAGAKYYRTRDTGQSLVGDINNDSWSAHVGLDVGAHRFTVARTEIHGDTPFDYVWNTWDFYLDTFSQSSDFNSPNERVWMGRYDYDFAGLGIPGLTFTTRYMRGTKIDGTDAGSHYAAYQNTSHGREWENDIWVGYVVQSGPAKDLNFRVWHATHRVGGDNTASANLNELRLIFEYPLDFNLL
ncbi:OprD family porin [Azotobacter beijerinckii]|uniref:Outer membrane porin, OprD family n=1 Tax=Azotobacter beijerinckii TaxID=170623 RepID=A0A1I4C254_9GAMM|nr:OprD family porin [Azotobacter beijerinckii]SFB29143.1 outer membrane porin, OprD family [Azotobacter beijerinckii]SFK74266.1 outer membrane porin, OprD family [Azotobacter beijerinckii]